MAEALQGAKEVSSHQPFFAYFLVKQILVGSLWGPVMRVPSHPTQIRRMLTSRLKQLPPTGPVLAASLSEVHKRCGQPSCAWARNSGLYPNPEDVRHSDQGP